MHSFRRFLPWLALTALGLLPAVHAVDINGTYENTGSLVSSATSQPEGAISFQGLLGLDFDYALTRALHATTNRVVITQTVGRLRIECRDIDDKTTWSGSWENGTGCTIQEDHIELIFRARRLKDDGFVFTLRTVHDRDLLLVDVQRVNATSFGPAAQPVGSFLFGRLTKE